MTEAPLTQALRPDGKPLRVKMLKGLVPFLPLNLPNPAPPPPRPAQPQQGPQR